MLISLDTENDIKRQRQLPVSSSKSYTLDDLTRLATEWITEQEGDTEMLKWTFSIFLEWARKREREVGDELV